MQLAGEQRRAVVVEEPQGFVPSHERRVRHGTRGRIGIDLDLDREHLPRIRRQADVVERAGETHECAVNGAVLPHAQLDAVPLPRQLAADDPKMAAQVVARGFAFQREVEVLGVSRQSEQEPQAGSAMEGERRHRSGALQRTENASLQVLARDVPSAQGPVNAGELSEVFLHTAS